LTVVSIDPYEEDTVTERPAAIVTAAGQGIGAAIARDLHRRGYRLALMSPSTRSVELANELGAVGLQGSVTEPADIESLVATAIEAFGQVDAVVNNTGFEKWSVGLESKRPYFDPDAKEKAHLLDIPDEDWHENLDLFVLNVVRMARAMTPHFRERGGGTLVNISAACAIEPQSEYPFSSSTRAALSSFTRLYSDKYARHNIRMNTILVGYVENVGDAETYSNLPMQRVASFDEIARNCALFLSDETSYITGESVYVDGGHHRAL